MTPRWQRAVHVLQLLRLEFVLAAISHAWLGVFLGYLEAQHLFPERTPWSLGAALGLSAVAAGGLAAYALALHDLLDARHDRAFWPARPIPAGRVRLRTALALALLCLLAALSAGVLLGTVPALVCLAIAAAALLYNIAGKYLPAVGIVLFGLIQALTVLMAAPWLSFLWPVWLALTHAMACATLSHLLEGKRPRLRGGEWWGLAAGWTFWTLALVGWMTWSRRPEIVMHERAWLGLAPLAAAAAFVAVAARRLRGPMRPRRTRRALGAEFLRLGMLWMIVYDAAWLLGAELYWPALAVTGLLALAGASLYAVEALARWRTAPPEYVVTADDAGRQ